jgi:hypothetical protein
MRKSLTILALSLVLVSGAAEAKKKPQLTPMELQALQSKEFETSKETLFASVMSVFQDLGYQVDNADVQTGFITAMSATQNKTSFFEALGGMNSSGNTRATAFVEKLPNNMARVRLNFLNSKNTSGQYGRQFKDDKPILDPVVYRTAWDKIDEALFVRASLDAPKTGVTAKPQNAEQVTSSAPSSSN